MTKLSLIASLSLALTGCPATDDESRPGTRMGDVADAGAEPDSATAAPSKPGRGRASMTADADASGGDADGGVESDAAVEIDAAIADAGATADPRDGEQSIKTLSCADADITFTAALYADGSFVADCSAHDPGDGKIVSGHLDGDGVSDGQHYVGCSVTFPAGARVSMFDIGVDVSLQCRYRTMAVGAGDMPSIVHGCLVCEWEE